MRLLPTGNISLEAHLSLAGGRFTNAYQDLELVHNGEEAMEAYAKMPNLPRSKKKLKKPF